MCDKLGLMHVHRLLVVRQVPVDILVKAEDVGSQLNSIRFENIVSTEAYQLEWSKECYTQEKLASTDSTNVRRKCCC